MQTYVEGNLDFHVNNGRSQLLAKIQKTGKKKPWCKKIKKENSIFSQGFRIIAFFKAKRENRTNLLPCWHVG